MKLAKDQASQGDNLEGCWHFQKSDNIIIVETAKYNSATMVYHTWIYAEANACRDTGIL